MKMKNGKNINFKILDRGESVTIEAEGYSLLNIFSDGTSQLCAYIDKSLGLNLDEEGKLAIDQPLPEPPKYQWLWIERQGKWKLSDSSYATEKDFRVDYDLDDSRTVMKFNPEEIKNE